MQGVLVFHNVLDAIRGGWTVCDATPSGYIVRQRINNVWQTAIVECKPFSAQSQNDGTIL